MSRITDTQRAEQLEAQLRAVKARIGGKARKERTAKIIALGILAQKMLLRHPEMDIDFWMSEAAKMMDDRHYRMVRNELEKIGFKRDAKT